MKNFKNFSESSVFGIKLLCTETDGDGIITGGGAGADAPAKPAWLVAATEERDSYLKHVRSVADSLVKSDANNYAVVSLHINGASATPSTKNDKVVNIALNTNYGVKWESMFGLYAQLRAMGYASFIPELECDATLVGELLENANCEMLFHHVIKGEPFTNPFGADAADVTKMKPSSDERVYTYFVSLTLSAEVVEMLNKRKGNRLGANK